MYYVLDTYKSIKSDCYDKFSLFHNLFVCFSLSILLLFIIFAIYIWFTESKRILSFPVHFKIALNALKLSRSHYDNWQMVFFSVLCQCFNNHRQPKRTKHYLNSWFQVFCFLLFMQNVHIGNNSKMAMTI